MVLKSKDDSGSGRVGGGLFDETVINGLLATDSPALPSTGERCEVCHKTFLSNKIDEHRGTHDVA